MNFFAKASGKRGEIFVYDAIGKSYFDDGVSAKSFAESLKSLGNVQALDLYINSPGGSVFEGVAIYNQLKRFQAQKVVHVDGIAASIASIIAMAGDEINIAANGTMMIHNPWGMAIGGATEMRKQADALDQLRSTLLDTYVARTGSSAKDVGEWMDAETWMTADEAVKRGFATKKTDNVQFEVSFPLLDKFAKVPDALKRQDGMIASKVAAMQMRVAQMNLGRQPSTV